MPPQTDDPLLRFADVHRLRATEADRRLFEERLRSFVPPNAFDAHAHLYDLRHLCPQASSDGFGGPPAIDHDVLLHTMQGWMGDRVIRDGLYFPFPVRHLDVPAANAMLAEAIKDRPGSRGLMIIRPQDDPAQVEHELLANNFAGFKVYHVFAERPDTFNATQDEFLPIWAWELADKHGLWITMHMVLPKALADPRNASYIVEKCLRHANARLVLAHAARGFHASHTVEAIDVLRGIDNVYFDTSAICEPTAFEAILRATGVTRLMCGSDFPVSENRGRAVSIGDGFAWLYEHNVAWNEWPHGRPIPVGLESLLALKQACRTMCLNDGDIERIFSKNARELLGLSSAELAKRAEEVQAQYRRAKQIIPGGTQLLSKRPEMFAPDHWPAYYEQAIGCEVIDTAGRRFLDMSSGGILACILGYADPDVNAAVIRRVQLGSMATQQTFDEVRLAELLIEIHPWAAMARFARSGGEAMALAVRIARTSTGRDKVAVCGYHGWHDWYLAANLGEAGSESLTGHLLPGLVPAGVPRVLAGAALPFTYNKLEELEAIVARHASELAAIVMEPTRQVDPAPGFLEGVRQVADRVGARLIFDEISIGWRLCLGGAHLKFGVAPDIAVFAKALSNGFAMSAVIGNEPTMAAAQQSFISSTYWTESVGPAAALACVRKMQRIDVPAHLAKIGSQMRQGWIELARRHGVPATVSGRPEMVLLGFDHPDANALMTLFTRRMLQRGILAAGSFNPTLAHEPRHVDRFLAAADEDFPELAAAIVQGDVQARIDFKPKHTMFARLTG